MIRHVSVLSAALLPLATATARAEPPAERELAREIIQTMVKLPGAAEGQRPVHAKGLVCRGTFAASKDAAGLSRAGHFRAGPAVSVTVRFSDGASDPMVADGSPGAGPRGLAVRFTVPGGGETDIVAMSHNGFVVGTGEEFLALQKAVVATDPKAPHPWPVERFLEDHPAAAKFVRDNRTIPASFANEAFFGNDAFVFVDQAGTKRAGRYQFVSVDGARSLTEAEAKAKPPGFLMDGLKARLADGPVRYRLLVQFPNPGDPTHDPSVVWPDDRKTVEVGVLSVTAVDPDSAAVERRIGFDPTSLTDGIELSDDPIPALRSRVYALSRKRRGADE